MSKLTIDRGVHKMTIIKKHFEGTALAALTISFSDGQSGKLKLQAQEHDIRAFWRVTGCVSFLDDASETTINKRPVLDSHYRTVTVETSNVLWYVKELGGKILPHETANSIVEEILRAQTMQETTSEDASSPRSLTCRG